MADYNTYSEKSLLQQVAAGNEVAFRQLVRQYAQWLHAYIVQLTHQPEMAEEIVQDIFIQIWLTRETLPAIRNLRHYLFIITRNRTYDALKKIKRQEKRRDDWQYTNTGQSDQQAEVGDTDLQLDLIEQAIAQLPPQQQKVWLLSRRQGKKYLEIAAEMNLSRETVKKYLRYATDFIRQYVVGHLDIWIVLCLLFQS